ncbi:uncharacterized protein [Arachis hypogaea]|uniref:uncharacterized protein isoform X4 n=1 Tax=Arachis hypogaea TaxID=3818 RepID=UPI0011056E32|nr:uncharacterized protein LOC112779652 isoform X4 [Arachis hypogaea]
MPFRARTAIFRWSLHSVPYSIHHHQPHSLHSSSSSILLKFTSLAQPQVNGKSVETCDDDGFLSWLERKAGCRISSSLSIGKSSYGRSLFASKAIKTGDCILKVPYRVQITADNLPAKIKSLISEEVANVAKLAVLLLIERKLGQLACMSEISLSVCRTLSGILISAVYHGKRSCITRQIFWNESELEMIHRSSVYWETINQKSQIERDFLAIRPIPFADFVNHDGNSEAIVMSDDDKQLSEVISDRDYAPGEQVLIRYGKFSNATLMLDFGFTVPYNIYDQVQIQLDIPKHDPLHKMKLELMQQYFVPSRKNAENLKHSWNIFTIKEVKWPKGKGKGLPQSLRAFARVLSCTNRQELDDLVVEAAQTDGRLGRRPLPDVNKEIQAHLMLSSLIGKLIEERSAAIMSLEESSNCSSFCVRVPVRRFMARDLLRGELRILNSAFTWLENYCLSST